MKTIALMEKHFDSVIYNCLTAFAKSAEWGAMSDYLNRLSNSAFRTASYVLAERVLPEVDNDKFWKCFSSQIQCINIVIWKMTVQFSYICIFQKLTIKCCKVMSNYYTITKKGFEFLKCFFGLYAKKS